MIFDVATLLATLSAGMKVGDLVEAEIDGLGYLPKRVIAPGEA